MQLSRSRRWWGRRRVLVLVLAAAVLLVGGLLCVTPAAASDSDGSDGSNGGSGCRTTINGTAATEPATASAAATAAATAQPTKAKNDGPIGFGSDSGGSIIVRLALLPMGFTADDAANIEMALLSMFNVSVQIVYEQQPSSSPIYHNLIKNVYLEQESFDVYTLDVTWTSEFADSFYDLASIDDPEGALHCENVAPGSCDFLPQLYNAFNYRKSNSTYNSTSIIATPWSGDLGILFYRDDLVGKYLNKSAITAPPYDTYYELIEAATTIYQGELKERPLTSLRGGYLFPVAAGSEELTSIGIELIYSNGGGNIVDDNGVVNVENSEALFAVFNASLWLSTVTPNYVLGVDSDFIANNFAFCTAPFMRNWASNYNQIHDTIRCNGDVVNITATDLPGAAVVGGWGLGIAKSAATTELKLEICIEIVKYLTSTQYLATRAELYKVVPSRFSAIEEVCGNSTAHQSSFCNMLSEVDTSVVVDRPSDVCGASYTNVSLYFSTWMYNQLSSTTSLTVLATNLKQLQQDLTSILYSASEGSFCGYANGVFISCEAGLSCVNSHCFNFGPLIIGLSVPLSVIFVVLFAVLVWTYLRRSNRAKNWGTYIIHSDQLSWEEKPLGRGSFGVVYKGRYRDTVVAIKRIINQDQSSEVVKAFKDEVKILVALRHPNIVLFMGACFEHDNLAIVTEFMVKGNLHSVLHDPRIVLDWSIRMQMLFDICCGMAYLHAATPPILHRDLKSPNILVDSEFRLKVSDFGLTVLKETKPNRMKRKQSNNTDYDEDNNFRGTPFWAAPEVLQQLEPYNEKCDVYSFGIICWEILTRETLYPGLNHLAVAYKVMMEDMRPEIPAECPDHLSTIMRKCWASNQSERPQFKELLDMFGGLASPYLKHFINNLKEFQLMRQKEKELMRQHDLDLALDEIAPEAPEPVDSIALVFVDLQHWSKLWDVAINCMDDALQAYSFILRRNMRRCRGYEVSLEGRSCIVAFQDVALAVRWALETQEDLTHHEWPEPIINSPDCPTVVSSDGRMLFRGLRARMGIHIGVPGRTIHKITKRTVFTGPMVIKGSRVCYTAEGGQVLLSKDAMDALNPLLDDLEDLQPQFESIGEVALSNNESEAETLTNVESYELRGRQYAEHTDEEEEMEVDEGATSSTDILEGFMSSHEWSIPPEDLSIESDCLGRGSVGEVFLGRYNDVQVAIKRMYRTDFSPSMLLSLSAEVSLLYQLRHPNLLPFIGASIGAETFCIVVEYMDRGHLRHVLLNPLTRPLLGTRIRMMADVAAAFKYLHSFNPPIIHRNLRTTNILVNSRLQVKVSDLGLNAAIMHPTTITSAAQNMWTAPEVMLGRPHTSESDVYSFGIVLWEAITCQVPFANKSSGFMDWVPLVVEGTRPALPSGSSYPPWSVLLIQAAWDGNPRKRPTFAKILEAFNNEATPEVLAKLGRSEGTDFFEQPPTDVMHSILARRPSRSAESAASLQLSFVPLKSRVQQSPVNEFIQQSPLPLTPIGTTPSTGSAQLSLGGTPSTDSAESRPSQLLVANALAPRTTVEISAARRGSVLDAAAAPGAQGRRGSVSVNAAGRRGSVSGGPAAKDGVGSRRSSVSVAGGNVSRRASVSGHQGIARLPSNDSHLAQRSAYRKDPATIRQNWIASVQMSKSRNEKKHASDEQPSTSSGDDQPSTPGDSPLGDLESNSTSSIGLTTGLLSSSSSSIKRRVPRQGSIFQGGTFTKLMGSSPVIVPMDSVEHEGEQQQQQHVDTILASEEELASKQMEQRRLKILQYARSRIGLDQPTSTSTSTVSSLEGLEGSGGGSGGTNKPGRKLAGKIANTRPPLTRRITTPNLLEVGDANQSPPSASRDNVVAPSQAVLALQRGGSGRVSSPEAFFGRKKSMRKAGGMAQVTADDLSIELTALAKGDDCSDSNSDDDDDDSDDSDAEVNVRSAHVRKQHKKKGSSLSSKSRAAPKLSSKALSLPISVAGSPAFVSLASPVILADPGAKDPIASIIEADIALANDRIRTLTVSPGAAGGGNTESSISTSSSGSTTDTDTKIHSLQDEDDVGPQQQQQQQHGGYHLHPSVTVTAHD